MATADECIAGIQHRLGQLTPAMLMALQRSHGYAYEALRLTVIGDALIDGRRWTWVHPGGDPRFSLAAGRSLEDSLASFSHVRNGAGPPRRLCQSVNIVGNSTGIHAVDIVFTRATGGHEALTADFIAGVLEVKNHSESIGPAVARDLIGLTYELWWNECQGRPLARTWLVSATALTNNAALMLDGHEVGHRHGPGPAELGMVLNTVAAQLRFHHHACLCAK